MRSTENGTAGRGMAPSREGLVIRARNRKKGKPKGREEGGEEKSHDWKIISEDEQKAERI